MMTKKRSAEKTVRDIRRATRRHYSAMFKKLKVYAGETHNHSAQQPQPLEL
jgi:ribosomal protein L13